MADGIANLLRQIVGIIWGPLASSLVGIENTLISSLLGDAVSSVMLNFTENDFIGAIMTVIAYANWIVFAVALLFFFLQIAKEKQQDWGNIAQCFFLGVIFTMVNQLFCRMCFLLPAMIVAKVSDLGLLTNITIEIDASSFYTILYLIVLIVITLIFFVVSVKALGQMLLQMCIAPFYIPGFLMGSHQASMEWIKGTFAAGFCYALQYIFFYGGFLELVFAGNVMDYGMRMANLVVAALLIAAAFGIPKALARFTHAQSGGGNKMYMAMQAANMARSMMIRG